MRFRKFALPAVLAGISVLADCCVCETEGCDATDKVARTEYINQGVAGAFVHQGNIVRNGLDGKCLTCPFKSGRIRIWRADGEVTDREHAEAFCRRNPPMGVAQGFPWFEIKLQPGFYIGCTSRSDLSSCGGFRVDTGKITTLHSLTPEYMVWFLSKPGEKPERYLKVFEADCMYPEETTGIGFVDLDATTDVMPDATYDATYDIMSDATRDN